MKQLYNEVSEIKKHLHMISDYIFDAFYNWRREREDKECTEKDAIAQCMMQMLICKIQSLLVLSEGVSVSSINIKVVDPISMIAIWRTLYEMTFIFHNIYIMPDSDKEHEILLYLWQIRGLNNRQINGISNYLYEKDKEKQQTELREIVALKDRISEIVEELNLIDQVKEQIENALKKDSSMISGFKFNKKDGKIIGFERINFADSYKYLFSDPRLCVLYNFMSMHSHPSYLTVLQFGQLFNNNENVRFIKTILTGVCKLSSIFFFDFCNSIKGAQTYYEKLSNEHKAIFNIYRL